MKHLAFPSLFFLISIAFGQVHESANGNVGIGTTAPNSKLHVAGNGAVIKLQNTNYEYTENGFYGWLGGYDKSGDEVWWIGEGSGASKNFGLYMNRDGYDLKILNKGKGIIINQNGRLRQSSDIPNDNSALFENTSTSGYGIYSKGGNGNRYAFHFQNQSNQTILYGRGNGLIGIGTTSPSTLLDIKSSDSRAELTLSGTANGAINAGVVLKATHSTNQRGLGVFMHDLGGANEWFIGRPYSGSDQFVINRRSNTSSHATVTSSLLHNTSSQITANLFTIKANGNTGVGTTTPDSKLTVKGNIHAEEVKVDLSVPGPDYVFKEDYDLKSLEEVQNYIKEYGHLPNIPSAKEMEANGIQLGEMNMKLLEKIEELTLYTLEQEEKLKAQNSKIEILEKENKKMVELEGRLIKIEELLNKK